MIIMFAMFFLEKSRLCVISQIVVAIYQCLAQLIGFRGSPNCRVNKIERRLLHYNNDHGHHGMIMLFPMTAMP